MLKTKSAVGIAAAALTVCATVGSTSAVASPTTATPSSTATASQTPGQHQGGKQAGHHRQAGFNEAKALAVALGTDETKTRDALKQARTDVRTALKANPKLTAAEREDIKATSLAKSLGVDKTKVSAALSTVADQARAERRAALKKRLDHAVTANTITQSDEDAILKAFDAKVISGRR